MKLHEFEFPLSKKFCDKFGRNRLCGSGEEVEIMRNLQQQWTKEWAKASLQEVYGLHSQLYKELKLMCCMLTVQKFIF